MRFSFSCFFFLCFPLFVHYSFFFFFIMKKARRVWYSTCHFFGLMNLFNLTKSLEPFLCFPSRMIIIL